MLYTYAKFLLKNTVEYKFMKKFIAESVCDGCERKRIGKQND